MTSRSKSPLKTPMKSKSTSNSTSPRRTGDKAPVEDFIKCELCRQMLDDPKSLSCLHSYCRDCLMMYISETTKDSNQTNIVCPICLQTTSAPTAAKQREEWVDHLPSNVFLRSYLEAVSLKDPKKECDTCMRQSKIETAQQWCSYCHDALCDDCVGFHNALKTTKQHSLTYLAKIRNQPIEKIVSAPLCKVHEGENVTKYCENHGEVVCEKCVAGNHKVCRDVKTLKESATRHKNEMSKVNEILQEEVNLSNAIHDDRVKANKLQDDNQPNILQKIQSVRQRINENLARCESQIIGQLYDIQGKEKAAIQSEMKESQRIRKSSGKIHGLGTNASKYGTDSHLLQIMPDTAIQGEHYKGKLASLNGRIKNTKIDFIIDGTLERLMSGVNKIGELRVTQTSAELPTSHHLRVRKTDSDPEDEYDVKSTRRSMKSDGRSVKSLRFETNIGASLVETFSGRTPSDFDNCWFTGIAYLSDGHLILADRNNNKIKLFNKQLTLVTEVGLQHQPFDIAVVSATEVAVTIPRENRIEIFNIGTTLSSTQSIPTSDRCYGISYAGNRFAVSCACASPPSIKILTRDGEEKHDICPEDNYHPMFFRPWYVKMDATGNNMYISDCHRCHVTCITGSVMKRFMYKDNSLNSPRGLHLTNDGRVLVCGFGSDNIQLVDANGELVGDLLVRTDDIIGPQNVTLNSACDTMVLTFDPSSGNSEVVKVYKINI